jgi:hypothetical protein
VDAEPIVVETIRYVAVCQECAGETRCCGAQVLVGHRLRWDVESACPACGFAVAVCGGDLPKARRDQLLADHGPATLRVTDPTGQAVPVLRVLRAALGLDVAGARAALSRLHDGTLTGTLPETELLARRLRAAGVPAEAVRSPRAAEPSEARW